VTLTLSGATKEQIRLDDRAHVFHSWSAQALIDPLPIASRPARTSPTTTATGIWTSRRNW
jgi:hypothetical protein